MLTLASIALGAALWSTAGVEVHGDVHERIARIDKIIADEPLDAGLYLRRARLHREDENWPAAAADLARAAELAPSLKELDLEQALLAAASGRVPVQLRAPSSPNFGPAPRGTGIPGGVTPLVASGAGWRYKDDGITPPLAWRQLGFNDSTWAVGPSQLGYGDGDEATVVGFGPNPAQVYPTTWFRHQFTISGPVPTDASIAMIIDDGALVYLNGVEVVRHNLPTGPVGSGTYATVGVNGTEEQTWQWFSVPGTVLRAGVNQLAVEVHQVSPGSSDLSMDLVLLPTAGPSLARRPYIQAVSADEATINWRSLAFTDSTVWWGLAPGQLTQSVNIAGSTRKHEVRISGLPAASTVYYAVGDSNGVFAGDDLDHRFKTAPLPTTSAPMRAWILGDPGEVGVEQDRVRDAFYAWEAANGEADFVMALGDNAYPDGSDADYQVAFFEPYYEALRRLPIWSTRGNHDFYLPVYEDIFAPPTAGECGGVPSGTEAWYSFDWGSDVHIICLDSWQSSPLPNSPMVQWLHDDLAATDATWTIVFFHHPPYTRGNHNSDDRQDSFGRLVDMRMLILPILEDYGVDLVLTGHSHSYERSMLLQGHYGPSISLAPEHQVDAGDGRLTGDGAYWNTQKGHSGTVHAVCGSSSHTNNSGTLDHPVMIESLLALGSMILEVVQNRLDLRFLDDLGVERDHFTMYTRESAPIVKASVAYAGSPVTIRVTDLLPGAECWVYISTGLGSAPVAQGMSALAAPVTLLSSGTADARGHYSFQKFIPAGALGLSRTMQAVEATTSGEFLFGPTQTIVVQ